MWYNCYLPYLAQSYGHAHHSVAAASVAVVLAGKVGLPGCTQNRVRCLRGGNSPLRGPHTLSTHGLCIEWREKKDDKNNKM